MIYQRNTAQKETLIYTNFGIQKILLPKNNLHNYMLQHARPVNLNK